MIHCGVVVDALLRVRVISSLCSPPLEQEIVHNGYMRSCPLQRSLGRIMYGLHFLNPLPSLARYLNHSIPVIGCTAVGIRSKTIEIKKSYPRHSKYISSLYQIFEFLS